MKQAKSGETWFFVDESGDPTFYDRKGNLIVGQPGCSPILVLGFVEVADPAPVRRAILDLQRQIVSDPYFGTFPSMARTAVAFHAKDDVPEARYLFYKLLETLDFQTQFIVARKIERVFRNRFNAREMEFYDYLVSRLFENVLHRHKRNRIYFAQRGSRDRQQPLLQAIRRGLKRFEQKWGKPVTTELDIQAQMLRGEPCLSVIDYMNWAVYQAFTRREMRYYRVVADKVRLLVDLYDTARYPNNWYSRRNPFDAEKITPV
jgi:hypothetical protein